MARAAARAHARPRPRATAAAATVPGAAGREALALDRIIHDRTRLGLLSALAVAAVQSFVELRTLLDTTDGNLSVHARKLEEAGYVECTKTFADRVPRTEYRITPAGRKALEGYLKHMEALIRVTRR